jgi:diacylglycerol kinase (ATP)
MKMSNVDRKTFLAILNPNAGGGRCGKLAGPVLNRLRQAGVVFETVETHHPGHAVEIAKDAWRRGIRRFLAVGGDGTSFEIVNGLFPAAAEEGSETPILGLLPLGTGNSFLRDFTKDGPQYAFDAIVQGRTHPCDVLCMEHAAGSTHYINLLSMGFPADVCAVTNRRFKSWGPSGYWMGRFACLVRLRREVFPLSMDNESSIDRRRSLLLTFSNWHINR